MTADGAIPDIILEWLDEQQDDSQGSMRPLKARDTGDLGMPAGGHLNLRGNVGEEASQGESRSNETSGGKAVTSYDHLRSIDFKRRIYCCGSNDDEYALGTKTMVAVLVHREVVGREHGSLGENFNSSCGRPGSTSTSTAWVSKYVVSIDIALSAALNQDTYQIAFITIA